MKLRAPSVISLVCVSAAFVALGASFFLLHSAERGYTEQVRLAKQVVPAAPVGREATSDLVVTSGSSLDDLLRGLDVDPEVIATIVQAARPVFNFRRLRDGNRITLTRSPKGDIESLVYEIDRDHELWVTHDGEPYKAEVRDVPSTTKIEAIAGSLDGSLFESITSLGETPELAIRLAEIFAYDLDFYTDPRPGDVFRIVLEKREYGKGQPASYGRILMAEYNNAGHLYRAVLFHDTNGQPAYYSDDGKSLQKAFLRSPLKFAARISSHFSRSRFHPVLKIYRPHLGTDYAAPVGTPVQAIANGNIILSGYQGGGGNIVEIRHNNGYVSYYMHLSRRLVHTGQKVRQGQRIGLVGATGLATGPHLDFRLRRNGSFVNFERMHLPPAYPVAKKDMPEGEAERDKWMPLLSAAPLRTPAPSTPTITASGNQ